MLKFFRGKKNFQLFGLPSPDALWIFLFFNLPILIVLFISFVERGRAGVRCSGSFERVGQKTRRVGTVLSDGLQLRQD